MKISIQLIAFFLFFSFQLSAQKGINFLKTTNFYTAVNTAKQQNKILFIEAYAPDCHICNSFKGTFAQPQVGAVYNSNFVNFQLDMNNPDNFNLLKKYKIIINATPTFLFFDPKTMKIVQAKVFGEKENSVINVNSIGQKAANPAEHASKFQARFMAGDRNLGFLLNYAQFARISGDTINNIKAMNEYAKALPQNQWVTQTTLNTIQSVMMHHDNPLFDYFVKNLNVYNRNFDANLVKMIYENIFQNVLTSSQSAQLTTNDLQKLKSQMKIAGLDESSILRRTWMVESSLFFKQKKPMVAISLLEKLLKSLPNAPGPKEYQYLCDFVKTKTKDKKALKFAQINWCKYGLQ